MSSYCKLPFYEVIGLDEGKPYKFRVSAENEQGVSIPLETESTIVPKTPYVKPSAPSNLKVLSQTSETVTLVWDPPANNGGAKISGYNIEVQDNDTEEWLPVNEMLIRGNTFTAENLRPDVNYSFRVKAKNAAGWGPATKEDVSAVLKPEFTKPDAPRSLQVKKVGNSFVELEWEAPLKDGGDKIGYVIEKKEKDSDFWIRAISLPVHDLNRRIDDLPENSEVEFRIKAVNRVGESEPCSTTGRIKITEYPDGIKPEFVKRIKDSEGSLDGEVSFKVEFEGKPQPVAKWYKNGIEVQIGKKFEIIQETSSSILTVKHLNDTDNNSSVTCVITNPLGKDNCDAIIKIIAIPKIEKEPGNQSVNVGDPFKMKVPIVGKGPFNLKLLKLDENGDLVPVDNIRLSEIDGTLTVSLPSAQRGDSGDYVISIGNNSGALEVPMKLKVKAPPEAPQGPLEVSDIGKNNCTLTWKQPSDDGGSRVTHYIIEKRDCAKGPEAWIPYTDHCKVIKII